jgi:3',5'-nucleoside bisphosphate phosphatase
MSPKDIAAKAKTAGLELIALTDHNSALNCPAFAKACATEGLTALFGCEVTSREEVHILCLFDSLHAALELSAHVAQHMPQIPNQPERLGDQIVVDDHEQILTQYPFFLGVATTLSLEKIAEWTVSHNGLCIPAHIDRRLYGLITQLGFLPDHEPYAAVEIHKSTILQNKPFPDLKNYTAITNSDSHNLDDIGCVWTEYDVNELSLAGIRQALQEKKVAIRTL